MSDEGAVTCIRCRSNHDLPGGNAACFSCRESSFGRINRERKADRLLKSMPSIAPSMPPLITASVASVAGRDSLNNLGRSTLSQHPLGPRRKDGGKSLRLRKDKPSVLPKGPDQSQGGQTGVGVLHLLHGSDEAVNVAQLMYEM
ncbi:hypothetical protein EYF80_006236 [Liparis tanakae]|uniref:Uncharacterized protein n=1 Tax=Liparis tanakae TaxID=230148 RepID=A0A4Z2J1Y8_9TELE|nr:hypothetical protein EYF80_006236 [Liparis tanakae]